jgi:hypothetical protein
MKKLLLALLIAISSSVHAQHGWVYSGNFNFGANIIYVFGNQQKFPGFRIFAGFAARAVCNDHFILNYGPSLSIYNKQLGASLNPKIDDVQVDLINSITFGAGGLTDNPDHKYDKYIRTMGNGAYYNLVVEQDYAFLLTSNIIFNNHKHHQVNGAWTVMTPWATINYYNDGAAPVSFLPISDNFDRYWTGGIGLFVHNKQGYNNVEFTFDQFTGYRPMLYETATMLGIDVPNYNLEKYYEPGTTPTFNASAYNLKIKFDQNFGLDLGALGGLMTDNGTYYGMQDIIHSLGKYAIHPNADFTRIYFGGTYNNINHVEF